MTRYLEIKPGSISEVAKNLRDDYQAFFKKELEKTGKSITSMTDAEKKSFFNKVDKAYNAKNEQTAAEKQRFNKYGYADTAAAYKSSKEPKTTLVAKPGDKEKVVRIPKEKLADYKSKGWVEAESFVPEAAKEPYAIGMAAAMKQTGDKPPLKKSTITKAHDIAKSIEKKEEVKEETLEEGGMKEIDTNKQELRRLDVRLSNLKDKMNAAAGADTTDIEKQYHQTKSAILDIKKKIASTKKEEVEITEITDEEEKSYARQITSLSNDKVMARINKKGDAAIAAIQKKIDDVRAERDKKRAQKNEEAELEEAAGPDRLTNLNDKITRLQVNLQKLDKSKPESKTKEAILKSDLTTAKLRLQDLMKKRNAETKQESVNEAKKNYKSIKKSLKKEQDKEVNSKRTLTDKPITKIDVDPKVKD